MADLCNACMLGQQHVERPDCRPVSVPKEQRQGPLQQAWRPQREAKRANNKSQQHARRASMSCCLGTWPTRQHETSNTACEAGQEGSVQEPRQKREHKGQAQPQSEDMTHAQEYHQRQPGTHPGRGEEKDRPTDNNTERLSPPKLRCGQAFAALGQSARS